MFESLRLRIVRLSSGHLATLHTQDRPVSGDLVLIEYQGARQLARYYQGRYLAPSGTHEPHTCRLVGVLRITR